MLFGFRKKKFCNSRATVVCRKSNRTSNNNNQLKNGFSETLLWFDGAASSFNWMVKFCVGILSRDDDVDDVC